MPPMDTIVRTDILQKSCSKNRGYCLAQLKSIGKNITFRIYKTIGTGIEAITIKS